MARGKTVGVEGVCACGLALASALLGCHVDHSDAGGARGVPPVSSSADWARAPSAPSTSATAAASAAPSGSTHGGRDAVMSSADARALAEILGAASAAPRAAAPRALIGSDTHGAKSAEPATAPAVPRPPVTAPEHALASSSEVERAARAELYWPLTNRCRDESGALLPARAVEIFFRIDDDGRLVSSSVVAIARDKRFDRAAMCMRREIAKAGFRAPAGARGAMVNFEVPSPD